MTYLSDHNSYVEEKMHITKSHSLLVALKGMLNVNTDLLLHGQTNGM